jgi:SAM-dependent methyltransferase
VSDKLELLPVSLLDECRGEVERLRRLAKGLATGIGWHYLLDLPWVLRELGPAASLRVLDAGAGLGLLQWRLAEDGAHVLSVDRSGRELLPLHYRLRFETRGLRPRDLRPLALSLAATLVWPRRLVRTLRALAAGGASRCRSGVVVLYGQDLRRLEDVADASVDAVASISALEHNDPADLARIVPELMRVLKPGGVLLATLGAAEGEDWYHEPSSGWCYGEASMRRLFGLGSDVVTNYPRYAAMLAELRGCAELRDGLDPMYFRSGRNGMPWGAWDPRYLPVGVRKVKRGA